MYVNSEKYNVELKEYIEKFSEVFKKLDNSSVLITGAAGLIGNYITDLLLAHGNIKVIAVDRNEVRMNERFSSYFGNDNFVPVIDDVNDNSKVPEIFGSEKVDYVIHAASNTSPLDYANKPIDTICTNIIATHNLLEACVENGVKRFMFCSSVEAYGAGREDVDSFDESYSGYVDSNTVRAGYPSGKRASEAMCNAYNSEKGLDFVIVRIGRIYGPTVIKEDTKAPTQFIKNAVNNEDIVLKSAGTQEFSFGYVGDCAAGMLKVLTDGETGNAYNIADPGSRVLLKEFAAAAANASGRKVVFELSQNLAKEGYSKVTKAVLSTDKLESIGWKPLHDYRDGTERTVNYLKDMKIF